jgi:hypothetical protein
VLRGDGPELFDGGGRSYVSETSSVHTVRPCAIKNSAYIPGVSSPRRDNPKTSGSNTDRGDGSLFVPAPREKPVCDVVAEYQGLKLCRVSDCVPYCEFDIPPLSSLFSPCIYQKICKRDHVVTNANL